ncbi:hypothetical protein DSLASN_44810 [Desulfoluna limicola]|uniref:Uncharacterized protein n=1 Tax=Desulfoluna limicola TaxID=2810562 RepID=A0ABN6F919_9BACT|nr:hypothetical protein [Desulfoluna limicola]BCS98849.1 hypothetical protein DSLASN_44810 [Desulfoluna limicola]
MTFDMKTAIFTYILINYLYTFVLGFLWYQSRQRSWGTGFLLADFLFKSIGMTLAILRGSLPPVISVVFANFLMFSGSIFMLFGMGTFLKVHISRMPYLLYTLLFTALYAWFALAQPDVRVRIMLFSGMLTPVLLYMATLVFRSKETALREHAHHAGVAFSLFALVSVGRFACALTGDPISGYFNKPITDSFLTILCQILSVYLAYAIYLMINGRLSHVSEFEADALERIPLSDTSEDIDIQIHS